MPDLSDADFQVALQTLWAAYLSVKQESGSINDKMSDFSTAATTLSTDWSSPAWDSFDNVQKWFTRVSGELTGLLEEIVGRLYGSYENYRQAESANYQNVNV